MIEVLVTIQTRNPGDRWDTWTYKFMPTGWRSLEELKQFYQAGGTIDLGTSGDEKYTYYHFPATAPGRAIYRIPKGTNS